MKGQHLRPGRELMDDAPAMPAQLTSKSRTGTDVMSAGNLEMFRPLLFDAVERNVMWKLECSELRTSLCASGASGRMQARMEEARHQAACYDMHVNDQVQLVLRKEEVFQWRIQPYWLTKRKIDAGA